MLPTAFLSLVQLFAQARKRENHSGFGHGAFDADHHLHVPNCNAGSSVDDVDLRRHPRHNWIQYLPLDVVVAGRIYEKHGYNPGNLQWVLQCGRHDSALPNSAFATGVWLSGLPSSPSHLQRGMRTRLYGFVSPGVEQVWGTRRESRGNPASPKQCAGLTTTTCLCVLFSRKQHLLGEFICPMQKGVSVHIFPTPMPFFCTVAEGQTKGESFGQVLVRALSYSTEKRTKILQS